MVRGNNHKGQKKLDEVLKVTIFQIQERLKKTSCVWPLLLPETMLMFVACVTTEGHVDVRGPCWPVSQPRAMLMSWSVLLLEAILKSVVHAAARCNVMVMVCSCRRPCGCRPSVLPPVVMLMPWSVLPLETMLRSALMLEATWMSVVLAVTRSQAEVRDPCYQ